MSPVPARGPRACPRRAAWLPGPRWPADGRPRRVFFRHSPQCPPRRLCQGRAGFSRHKKLKTDLKIQQLNTSDHKIKRLSAQISQGALRLEMVPGRRRVPRAPPGFRSHTVVHWVRVTPSLDSMLTLLLLRPSHSGEAGEQES